MQASNRLALAGEPISSSSASLLGGALEALGIMALLVDGRGRACGMTASAHAMLSDGPLRLWGDRLRAAHPPLDAELQERIAHALDGGDTVWPDLWISIGRQPCLVTVQALPGQEGAPDHEPRAMLTFRFPTPIRREDAVRLRMALPLTLAEAEVAVLLAAGLSRRAIAAARGTGLGMVNRQLRDIFAKCEVRREVDLVRLAVSLLAPR